MRCLTLADALQELGYDCHFICRAHRGNLSGLIRKQGHTVHLLPAADPQPDKLTPDHLYEEWLGADWQTDAAQSIAEIGHAQADWLIVDHYALDKSWERNLRKKCPKVMVIDDLANRAHECDVLIDQTFGRNPKSYHAHTTQDCTLLCGAQYALLRPEFAAWRSYSLKRRQQQPNLRHLLVAMGGVDRDNATCRVLEALRNSPLPDNCDITIVMGQAAPWLQSVREQAHTMPWPTSVLTGVSNMAKLMADSDFAIGAAGTTTWERCCLGLPSMMMILAENQQLIAKNIYEAGAAIPARLQQDNNANPLSEASALNPENMSLMSRLAAEITDGQGAQRVLRHLTES